MAVVTGACSSGRAITTAPTATTTATSAATTPTSAATTTVAPRAVAPGPCGAASAPPARYDHVVWIWMENHTADAVLSSADAPFEQGIAGQCGSARTYRAVGSPSLPNYLAAVTGSTHGVHDDGGPSAHPIDADNLFRQVTAAGGVARSYEEAMPGNCRLTGAGRYAVKHNPQAYLAAEQDRAACQRDDVPFDRFAADLDGGALPAFSFVTPDLCNDTHDCAVPVGDAWLQEWVGRILASSTYAAGRTAVFVVWDEPTPMPLLVMSPTTPAGSQASAPLDHYSLLRTTEELLGLPPLGNAVDATSLRPAFRL